MAKTKEEILKILEKNYKPTQVQELTVYDKVAEQHSEFNKDVKDLDKSRTAELKKIDKEEKDVKAASLITLAASSEKHQKHLAEVEKKKTSANQLLTKQLEASAQKELALLEGKQIEIAAIKKSFEKALKQLDKQLKSDLDASAKQIAAYVEKGEKDQAAFEMKINDLMAKES